MIYPELKARAAEIGLSHTISGWTFFNDVRARRARQVKIAEGVYVVERVVKLTGGLVRLAAVVRDDRLHDAYLSGDFFFYPAEALVGLENDLEGAPAEAVGLQARIQAYFNAHRVEAPGISPADLAQVLAA